MYNKKLLIEGAINRIAGSTFDDISKNKSLAKNSIQSLLAGLGLVVAGKYAFDKYKDKAIDKTKENIQNITQKSADTAISYLPYILGATAITVFLPEIVDYLNSGGDPDNLDEYVQKLIKEREKKNKDKYNNKEEDDEEYE